MNLCNFLCYGNLIAYKSPDLTNKKNCQTQNECENSECSSNFMENTDVQVSISINPHAVLGSAQIEYASDPVVTVKDTDDPGQSTLLVSQYVQFSFPVYYDITTGN